MEGAFDEEPAPSEEPECREVSAAFETGCSRLTRDFSWGFAGEGCSPLWMLPLRLGFVRPSVAELSHAGLVRGVSAPIGIGVPITKGSPAFAWVFGTSLACSVDRTRCRNHHVPPPPAAK